jgi:hypothetical protein
MSMNAEQAAWLDQLLATASRGGDARVLMRSACAGQVRRIVHSARDRAKATVGQRKTRDYKYEPVMQLLAGLAEGATLSKHEIAAATGLTVESVANVLVYQRQLGLVTVVGPARRSRWAIVRTPASVTQISERKAAVR